MLLEGLSSISDMLLLIQQYLSQNSGRQRLKNKHQGHRIISTKHSGHMLNKLTVEDNPLDICMLKHLSI
jgi:hypothetical protein